MEPRAEPRKTALPALTGARFFAAFAVVVWHYAEGATRIFGPLAPCTRAGPMAVSFFYVLSGAVMTWGCTGPDGAPARPTRTFWRDRAARILPAYGLALAASLLPFISTVMKLHPGADGAVRVVLAVLASSLLVQAFLPPLSVGLNTPGWSISCEAFFYACWPRLVTRLRSSRPSFPWAPAVALWVASILPPLLASTALSAGLVPEGPFATLLRDEPSAELVARVVSQFPPLRLPEFALGIVVGHALRRTPVRPRSLAADSSRELALAAVLVAVTWAFGVGLPERATGGFLSNRACIESGVTSLLFALIVWQLARGDGLFTRLFATPSLVLLGEASYALYILQEPVFVWVTAVLKRTMPAVLSRWDLLFWPCAALLVAISVLTHKRWEMPLRGLVLRRFATRTEGAATRAQP